jgi:ABC-type antimicrobial peptide transport system permease subunit
MVTRRGLAMSAAGLVLGLPLSFLIHRLVENTLTLFEADLGLGITFWAGGILAAVAVLASYLPARGAAKVEPTRALALE